MAQMDYPVTHILNLALKKYDFFSNTDLLYCM